MGIRKKTLGALLCCAVPAAVVAVLLTACGGREAPDPTVDPAPDPEAELAPDPEADPEANQAADGMEFWRQQVGEDTISLREAGQDGGCGLYLVHEEGDILLMEPEGEGGNWSVSLFEDILAHDGFVLTHDYGYYKDWTYYALEDGALLPLAFSWGDSPAASDYAVDADGDQERELICNVQFIADGVPDVLFYDWQQDKAMEGDLSALGDEPEEYFLGNPYFQYNPDTGLLEGFYWQEEEEEETFEKREYVLEMDKVPFYEFAP